MKVYNEMKLHKRTFKKVLFFIKKQEHLFIFLFTKNIHSVMISEEQMFALKSNREVVP